MKLFLALVIVAMTSLIAFLSLELSDSKRLIRQYASERTEAYEQVKIALDDVRVSHKALEENMEQLNSIKASMAELSRQTFKCGHQRGQYSGIRFVKYGETDIGVLRRDFLQDSLFNETIINMLWK